MMDNKKRSSKKGRDISTEIKSQLAGDRGKEEQAVSRRQLEGNKRQEESRQGARGKERNAVSSTQGARDRGKSGYIRILNRTAFFAIVFFCSTTLWCIVAGVASPLSHSSSAASSSPSYGPVSQEVDPFYMRSFDQGKSLYASGNYRDALKKFEVAAFGFTQEKELRIKAILFSSLCYFHLKDLQESKNKLSFALELSGEDGFVSLDLKSEVSEKIENLLVRFKFKERETVGRRQQIVSSKQAANKLEQDIKKTPRNPSLYYDLYYVYMEQNNTKAAKKTLEKLVMYNPREIEGLSLLGKMLYSDRKFKKCEEYFEKIITISNKIPVEKNIVDETGAYLILSSFNRVKRNLTQSRISQWIERLEKNIDILKLTDREKVRLQALFKSFKTKSQNEKEMLVIKNLENQFKQYPRRIEIYYDVYEAYLKLGRADAAKDTIKKLIKYNPREMNAYILLAKMEYQQKQYKNALKYCRNILESSGNINLTHEIIVVSMIYSILCDYHLNLLPSAKSMARSLSDTASKTEISNVVLAEGLEGEWEKVMRIIR